MLRPLQFHEPDLLVTIALKSHSSPGSTSPAASAFDDKLQIRIANEDDKKFRSMNIILTGSN